MVSYVLGEIRIDENGLALANGQVPLEVTGSGKAVGNSMAIEFGNGLVLGIFDYKTFKIDQRYRVVSFRVFDDILNCPYKEHFVLLIYLREYSSDCVKGVIRRSAEFFGVTSYEEVGYFTITDTETVWRGREYQGRFDKRRFAREMLLHKG